MLFDFKNLMVENTLQSENVFVNSAIEESYFINTLDYITESLKEFNSYKRELYIGILESGEDYNIVNESFSDFFVKAKELIDKFLKFIKSLFDKFITSLNRFISSEKYLIKNKDKLKKFGAKHEFDIEGFEFAFNDKIPAIEAEAAFKKDFIQLDFDDILKEKDPEKVVAMIDAQHSRLKADLNNDRYDVFRQEVIMADSPIHKDDFATELFATYRSGENMKSEITIDNVKVMNALGRLENHKSFQASVKKTKEKIERDYEKVKKSIDNMILRNKDNDVEKLLSIEIRGDYDAYSSPVQLSSQALSKLDLFLKTKVSEIVELSNIHAMAFSYKLDAIHDCYRQDKQILYKALAMIHKEEGKGGE